MEAHLYTIGLLRLLDVGVPVKETVTDAHLQIGALMSKYVILCMYMYTYVMCL